MARICFSAAAHRAARSARCVAPRQAKRRAKERRDDRPPGRTGAAVADGLGAPPRRVRPSLEVGFDHQRVHRNPVTLVTPIARCPALSLSHHQQTPTGQPNKKEDTMRAQRIEGAVALVTGANRGIGRALTEALLTRGVRKVYATARNPEALRVLRDERLVALRLDVTDADQIRATAEAASDVELVFNNAGVALAGGIADATVLDLARREMEVNYFGPLQLLQRLAPSLARNGGGAIVNIGSAAGLTNVPFLPTYSASKAALHSLTQAARILLGAQGTSVFGVYAGPVDTDMVRDLALPKTSPSEVAFAILDGIEAGQEDIFPDPFALDFGRQFESSPKASERQIAAMVTAMLSGSAV